MFTDAHRDDPEDQHDVVDEPISTVTETKLFSVSHEHVGATNHDTEVASAYALGPTHCMDAGNIVDVVVVDVAIGDVDEWRVARRCERSMCAFYVSCMDKQYDSGTERSQPGV